MSRVAMLAALLVMDLAIVSTAPRAWFQSGSPTANRTPTCQPGQCKIVLNKLVSLPASAKTGILPDSAVIVAQDASGRFLTTTKSRDRMVVFNAQGQYEAMVGTPGRSAGQFQRIVRIMNGA